MNVSDMQPIDDDVDLPTYKDRGWLLIEVVDIDPSAIYNYAIEEYAYAGSAFWIMEGTGIDYWVSEYIDIPECGWWVIDGITGIYTRGDGYSCDDDVDWDWETLRKATKKEIAELSVDSNYLSWYDKFKFNMNRGKSWLASLVKGN